MTIELKANVIKENVLPGLMERCDSLIKQGKTPFMHVFLVGNNSASLTYIKNKKLLCEHVGAKFELSHLPEDISESDFLKEVGNANTDPEVTGSFIQLPVPKHLKHLKLSELINPDKDLDCFHSTNIANLYSGHINDGFLPCTPKGILKIFKHYDIDAAGKNVVIIGRSLIVGKPLSLLLTNQNATVTLCHSKTENIKELTQAADIIISAVGNPKFLTADFFRKDKTQIVVDVGINKDSNGKTCGDVDFENVKSSVSAITPVPGGVGPLTVLSLIENLIIATERRD